MMLWNLALAEFRTCRRMIRTWVFIAIATSACLAQWTRISQEYAYDSTKSASYGVMGPRFMLLDLALPIVVCFAAGILFLAFDFRSRDVRNRMFETLESRPFSNVELLFGRLFGTVLVLFIPAIAIVLFIVVYSILTDQSGGALEPISAIAFVTWDIIPNLFLWGSLTVLLSVVLRFRLLVVLAVLGLLLLYHRFNATMPFFLMSSLSTYTQSGLSPSEIAPQFATWDIVLNRLTIVFIGITFLTLAAGLHPRIAGKPTRNRMVTSGICALTVAVLAVAGLIAAKVSDQNQVKRWTSLHHGHRVHSETDIDSINGIVDIHPGRVVHLDLSISIAPTGAKGDRWLLSLNPGYKLSHISVDGEAISNYQFEDGLLSIPSPRTSDVPSRVHLVASGVPNPLFAYLDTSLDPSTLHPAEFRRLLRLGKKPYVFQSQYFAMMPGVSWFPASGSAYGRGTLESRPTDYFDLDIEVSVPRDWLVAGPGTRQEIEQEGRARYRFNPQSPIPEFALVGSRFERRAFEAAGIEFELLLSEKHTDNFYTLEGIAPAFKEWVHELVTDLNRYGLEYPFGTLSFVEVPVSMRVYGGGWQMDSVYSPPGIQMVRESGFPIVDFGRAIEAAGEQAEGSQDLVEDYMVGLLRNYFLNDLYGNNPLLGLAKQFVNYQTAPVGYGATALNFVSNELVSKMAVDNESFFSVRATLTPDSGMTHATEANPNGFFARYFFHYKRAFYVDTPSAWELALSTSLADLDYDSPSSEELQALMVKSLGLSRSVHALHSKREIGEFLYELVSRFRGRSYSPQEFFDLALANGIDFNSLLGDWLYTTDLPGLTVLDPKVELVPNGEGGAPLFQSSFTIRNGRPTPGVTPVYYEGIGERHGSRDEPQSEPIHISGNTDVRVALHTKTPLSRVTLRPHLALNRVRMPFYFPNSEGLEFDANTPILPYVSEIAWGEEPSNSIVVDDLDPGFSVINGEDYTQDNKSNWWVSHFLGVEKFKHSLSYGLPTRLGMDDFPRVRNLPQWERDQYCPTCYGEYYATYTVSPYGFDEATPSFTVEHPSNGKWRLEFHIPNISTHSWVTREGNVFGYKPRTLGVLQIAVSIGEQETVVELDTTNADSGWNDLGIFEVDSRNTRVTVVEVRNGIAVADAIRWTPIENEQAMEAID